MSLPDRYWNFFRGRCQYLLLMPNRLLLFINSTLLIINVNHFKVLMFTCKLLNFFSTRTVSLYSNHFQFLHHHVLDLNCANFQLHWSYTYITISCLVNCFVSTFQLISCVVCCVRFIFFIRHLLCGRNLTKLEFVFLSLFFPHVRDRVGMQLIFSALLEYLCYNE